MASFVVTCTTDCLFAGTYTQVNDDLFTKGTYRIIRYKGVGIPDSYAGVASNGKDKLTLKRVGATNEFTGTEKYTNGKLYRGGPDSYAERPVQAVYIPADVPPTPPVAVPSPAGLGVDRVPQPDPTTKPDPAHAKVDNPESPIEQKTSVPSGPPLTVPQTPASSSSSSDPRPPPSSSDPPPPPPPPSSSSARGMPTSSIVAIVLAGIVGVIMLVMVIFYIYDSYDPKSTGDQRRIRNAQRRY
jgi:hypothetical protein